jgi:hypothetical protein
VIEEEIYRAVRALAASGSSRLQRQAVG